jgi:hypothetical protein
MSYDDDLKKRMELARQQGWGEDEIQRTALIERAQNSQKQQQTQRSAQQKAQQQKTKQQQGTFSAGNPLGFATSLLPFGEILRKKLNNESISGGDVALETVLSALPFAGKLIGKGAKAIKGAASVANVTKSVGATAKSAKAASKVVKATGRVDDVLREKNLLKELIKGDPTKGVVAGKLTKSGEALKAQARGVIPGVKPQGAAEKLLPGQADEINKTLNTVERGKTIFGRSKVGTKGSVNSQLRTVEQAQTKALGEMDEIIKTKNVPIVKKDVDEIIESMRTTRKDILGLKPDHLKEIKDLEKRVAATKDVKGLETLRKSADKRINFARNPNSPDPALEEVYLSLRRSIDDKSTKLIPDLKIAKTTYGKLEAAKDTLIQSSPATMRQFAGQGATSRLLGGSVAQNLTDKAGRVLTRAGKIQASPVTKLLQIKAPFSAAGAFGSSQPGPEIPTEFGDIFADTQDPNEAMINELYAAGITDPQQITDALVGQGAYAPDAQMGQESAPSRSSEYSDMAYQAIQAGDLKTAKSYMDFAKTMAEFEKNAGDGIKGGNLNSTASGVIADTETGLAALQNLSQNITKNNANNPIIGQARALNPWDTTAQSLQADISTTRQIVGKALEGGVLRKEDEVKYKKILPTVGDTDDVAQYKIQALVSLISQRLAEYQRNIKGGSGGIDINDLNQGEYK